MTSRHGTQAGTGNVRWTVPLRQELRDLWIGGRGPLLTFLFSALIGMIAYIASTNTTLNFLEQRESVNLAIQVMITIGGLLTLVVAADAISGERERGTLETLLVTPVPRSQLAVAKLVSALSLWLAVFVVGVPYVWFLGRGAGIVVDALVTGFVVGTLLAVCLAALGIIVSLFATSNRVSLSLSLFILFALFAPTQLPSGTQHGWAADLFLRVNPVTAGSRYVGKVVVDGFGWTQDADWLASPIVGAVVLAVAVPVLARRFLRLGGGSAS